MKMKGKNIIITGGTTGIGKATVQQLSKNGANIVILSRNVSDKFGSDSNIHQKVCDVSNSSEVFRTIDETFAEFGSIDVLINNAAILEDSPLVSLTKKGFVKHDILLWKKIIDTNLSSVFYVTSSVVEKMVMKRTKGLVINISSISAEGNPGQTAYSASKAGVNALTKTWSKELVGLGIRVAGISPGFTRTKMIMSEKRKNLVNEWERKIPLKRLAEPSEIADAILFVIKNDYFHGKILDIDGGINL